MMENGRKEIMENVRYVHRGLGLHVTPYDNGGDRYRVVTVVYVFHWPVTLTGLCAYVYLVSRSIGGGGGIRATL